MGMYDVDTTGIREEKKPMSISYHMPTRVLSGVGCVMSHAALLQEYGKRAFIVTGSQSARTSGALRDVIGALEENDLSWVLFDKVEANPSIETVREASVLGRENGVDFVMGIGGGSPMDAAKAIAALLTNNLDDHSLFAGSYPVAVPPILCVPTTAGTGSEVTPYAILTDHASGTKRNMGGVELFPRLAFLDASYMKSLPWTVTINTAVDALSHALEGWLAVRGNALSEPFALTGIREMVHALNELAVLKTRGTAAQEIPFDLRERALHGSMFGGMTIAQTGTTVLHAMGYCLTMDRNIDHGLANGLLMPGYLRFLSRRMPDRMKQLEALLGLEGLDDFSQFLLSLFDAPESLPLHTCEAYADTAIQARNVANTPVPVAREDLAQIFCETRVPKQVVSH